MPTGPGAVDPPISPPSSVPKPHIKLLKWLFVLAIVAFWFLLIRSQWAELSTHPWSMDWGWAALSTACFALYYLLLGTGWGAVARSMGCGFPLPKAVGVWLLSMPARYIPGNVWHIMARMELGRQYGVPGELVLASSVVEQALTVLTAACLGVAWIPYWAGNGSLAWAGAVLAGCLVALQPSVLRLLLRIASRLLRKPVLASVPGYRSMLASFAWYSTVNAVNGIAFALLSTALAGPAAGAWPALASAYCLAYVIGYVSFLTPSGTGVREAVLVPMLSLYMPVSTAVALSLLSRLLSVAGEALAVAGFGLPLAGRRALGRR